jgi:hypothetical protein
MSDGEDWIMRPIVEGLCRYESLHGTLLSLEDFARMNAALDVKYENQERYRKANEET